nr:hypothetical protein BaRGS_031039 [Batillaria attramentaria]
MMLTMGIFIGVILSNLQYTDMSSTRNLAIVGISLLLGLMMPYWLENNRDSIQTGTLRERGIGMKEFKKEAARADDEDDHAEDAPDDLEEGLEVYDLPWLPDSIQRSWVAKTVSVRRSPIGELVFSVSFSLSACRAIDTSYVE